MLTSSVICWLFASLQQGNVQKSKKQMKTFNIDGENLHIFWTTWVISMKFSGKMWVMIVLKVTKYQALNLSLEDAFLEKPLTEEVWEGGGC